MNIDLKERKKTAMKKHLDRDIKESKHSIAEDKKLKKQLKK